jgi:pimeloyl-ACP methyl ester carboxylesterase
LGGCAALVDIRADRREAESEAAYPAVGKVVIVDGKRIHAEMMGKGPDLVLIHGAGGNTRDFTFQLTDKLADHYRVTVFDRPGMGYSDNLGETGNDPIAQARVLQTAARELGLKKPIVLGHSYGGAVAMGWALSDPSYTKSLVIVSGATMPFPGDLAFWYKATGSKLGSAIFAPLLTAFVTDGLTSNSIDAIFAPEATPPGYADYIGAGLTLRRASLKANGQQVLSLKGHLIAMEKRYDDITMPVEIIHGLADTTVPARVHAIPLSQRLSNAHLTLIEGAGHMIHHTRHAAVIAAIDRAASR